ncbi:histidine phosphatase family protein [Chitinophagaceae bacterium LB-8]|uniref:Histidine phosphatase family protein n=1 Tax=Paraflavisolibacter caeni TaxID=2982496 RepID=A0A9X2XPF2_9BACT|nr:histidine phosphatase family protein [Paraflavisolibacter caeni]MCU7550724.1 histidine phosphatase family protein [Paraflavisolibacter caeni]
MKTLLLVRHAKSNWNDPGIDDIDRPLNDRGKADAPIMAKRLKNKGIKIDTFISSPAKRAQRTARFFAEEYGLDKKDIVIADKLYMATPSAFTEAIRDIKNKHDVAILFSHNPGITEFANTLSQVRIDDMPTCSIFAVTANTDTWADFEQSEKSFLFFDYPKNPMEA